VGTAVVTGAGEVTPGITGAGVAGIVAATVWGGTGPGVPDVHPTENAATRRIAHTSPARRGNVRGDKSIHLFSGKGILLIMYKSFDL
jgi:hypothetical protein